jgi:hypothetical protein
MINDKDGPTIERTRITYKGWPSFIETALVSLLLELGKTRKGD